jgi:hypothetical protein
MSSSNALRKVMCVYLYDKNVCVCVWEREYMYECNDKSVSVDMRSNLEVRV